MRKRIEDGCQMHEEIERMMRKHIYIYKKGERGEGHVCTDHVSLVKMPQIC